MKQVYKLNTKMLEDSENFCNFYEKLSAKRRQKIDGYRMEKDKFFFIVIYKKKLAGNQPQYFKGGI